MLIIDAPVCPIHPSIYFIGIASYKKEREREKERKNSNEASINESSVIDFLKRERERDGIRV